MKNLTSYDWTRHPSSFDIPVVVVVVLLLLLRIVDLIAVAGLLGSSAGGLRCATAPRG